jgi:hypothetical protein
MLELKSEFLCEVVGELDDPQLIGPSSYGLRVIIPVIGGTVKGLKVNGEVLPFGADWLLIRPDGMIELDVRVTIRTEDGELIFLHYRGVSNASPEIRERIQKGEDVDPSEYYFRTTPIFETGSEKYSWLNKIICVGVGKTELKRVRYKIYQIL